VNSAAAPQRLVHLGRHLAELYLNLVRMLMTELKWRI